MTLLTDEHVSPAIANTLRSEGIDAVTVVDTRVAGEDDLTILEFASENEYAVLTNDRDFITEEFPETIDHWGIFYYEDQRTSRADIVRSVHNALSVVQKDELRNEIIYIPGGWL